MDPTGYLRLIYPRPHQVRELMPLTPLDVVIFQLLKYYHAKALDILVRDSCINITKLGFSNVGLHLFCTGITFQMGEAYIYNSYW